MISADRILKTYLEKSKPKESKSREAANKKYSLCLSATSKCAGLTVPNPSPVCLPERFTINLNLTQQKSNFSFLKTSTQCSCPYTDGLLNGYFINMGRKIKGWFDIDT